MQSHLRHRQSLERGSRSSSVQKLWIRFFGEDHMFSKHMRDMGLKMYIYPNVDITHWGYQQFPGNFDLFLKKRAAEMKKIAEVQFAEQKAQLAS